MVQKAFYIKDKNFYPSQDLSDFLSVCSFSPRYKINHFHIREAFNVSKHDHFKNKNPRYDLCQLRE